MTGDDLQPHQLMQIVADFFESHDVLLNKLVYFKLSEGVSQKHLRDIAGMMKLLGAKLDRQYIQQWSEKLNVETEWRLMCERIDRSTMGS